jgi:cystathionine beta-lyase
MAAIAAVTHLLKVGDEILADWDLYGGTSRLFGLVLPNAGITVRYVDASVAGTLEESITSATRMIYVESPTNPMLRIIDLAATAMIAKRHGLLFCVDNSAMSPFLQNPLDLGADITLHSATKFLCGHSDVTGGVVVVKEERLADEIYFLQNAEGSALGPFDSYLLLRGLKTLKIRMDAQQLNASFIASFLLQHSAVGQVFYPGSPDHPGHGIHQAQARGGGALLSFTASSAAAAKAIAEKSRLFQISVSFGSVNSTINLPAKMSHASIPTELLSFRLIPDSLLRLSIGIEDAGDLVEDLSQSLA